MLPAHSLYAYKAVHRRTGKVRSGRMLIEDESALASTLNMSGYDLINCRKTKQIGRIAGSPRVSLKELDQFYTLMYRLVMAKIPLQQGLRKMLENTMNKRIYDTVLVLYQDIQNGKLLSEAMARHPRIFNKLDVAIIMGAEASGDLEEAFSQLSEQTMWTLRLRKRIRKALIYPAVLVVVLVVMLVVMLGFAVPSMVEFLESQHMELPFYTVALIQTGKFMQSYWWAALGALVAIPALLTGLYKAVPSFRRLFDTLVLKIPVVGTLIEKVEISRFVRALALLYNGGCDLFSGLKISREMISNSVIYEAVGQAVESIREGQGLSEAFMECGHFSYLAIDMMDIGQEIGTIGDLLLRVSEIYNEEVDEAIDAVVALIEPVITIILAALLLWIAISVFGPIYSSFENLNI